METLSSEAYLRKHHLSVYLNDAVNHLVSSQVDNPADCLLDYLSGVLVGNHVLNRDFAYVSATPYNRRALLNVTKDVLQSMSEAGPMTMADCHNMLRMVCPDFPLGPIKNAWNTALAIHIDSSDTVWEPSQQAHQAARLPFSAFFSCLEITFSYERYLMDLRKKFFDASKRCIKFSELKREICDASKREEVSGWPVPPITSLEAAVLEASSFGKQTGFEFRKLVVALSCHKDLRNALEEEEKKLRTRSNRHNHANPSNKGHNGKNEEDRQVETPRNRKKGTRGKTH
ncbi:hypothetical protein BSKO_01515 [Bryopsis sp. KO-2023]|nr:hypothetical protein BSKO_01515 [Bryopsis sp. KO-2023]